MASTPESAFRSGRPLHGVDDNGAALRHGRGHQLSTADGPLLDLRPTTKVHVASDTGATSEPSEQHAFELPQERGVARRDVVIGP